MVTQNEDCKEKLVLKKKNNPRGRCVLFLSQIGCWQQNTVQGQIRIILVILRRQGNKIHVLLSKCRV